MDTPSFFSYIVNEIHTVVAATADGQNLPVTCAIDIMHYDANGLYFLTAKGKHFYDRLKNKKYIAFTGIKGADTLSSIAVSVRGNVTEIGPGMLPLLFEKNGYMQEIYPTELSRAALTVFQIDNGIGEWFDLSHTPIERKTFPFGGAKTPGGRYWISQTCTQCGRCLTVCPQNCILPGAGVFTIRQENCLHCGNCYFLCPEKAVKKQWNH